MEVSSRSAGVLPSVTAAEDLDVGAGSDALAESTGQRPDRRLAHPDRSVTVDDLRARVADVVGG